MPVIFEGSKYRDHITGTELPNNQLVALKDKANKLYDLREELIDMEVLGITKSSPEYIQIHAQDAALLLGYVLNTKFGKEIKECTSNENNFTCDFYGDPISTKDFASILDMMKQFKEKNLSILYVDKGKFSVEGVEIGSVGPHSDSFENLYDHILLRTVAGLHENRPAQRVTGSIFATKEEMDNFEKLESEAKELDHRVIGARLGLFKLDPELMPGMITWLHDGVKVLETMKSYIRSVMQQNGYKEVITPPFADVKLWQKSGHLDMFKENMFFIDVDRDNEKSNFALKPMNCPLHIEIFKHLSLSYKDLPYKISEFGFCSRYESSGSLHGLMRTRGLTQDDAHVFCTEAQIEEVIINFCSILKTIYARLGFNEIKVCLETRPEKFAGTIQTWELAESALASATTASGLEYTINQGDGAFYGPKLAFYIQDNRKRVWQCGTIQLDFVLPTRLGANYVDSSGNKQIPVMIHHAVLGSLERFIGVLIEHTKGRLPFWLAPKQVIILPISIQEQDHASKVENKLRESGFRASVDGSSQTLGYKIRHWWGEMHAPVICIIGKQEANTDTVSLRINGVEFGNKISMESMFNKLNEMGNTN